MNLINHPFSPVYDESSKVLILGSFPSITSRCKKFYYAHPLNRFWPVLEIIFNEKITDKKAFLLKNNIALWDVIATCTIASSSDASIKNVQVNDINLLLKKTNIKYIFTEGNKAYELYKRYIYPQTLIPAIKLPSTSPRNAKMKLADLVEEFQKIKKFL